MEIRVRSLPSLGVSEQHLEIRMEAFIMKRKTLAALFGFGLFATLAAPAESQTITEQEAHAIGVDAYLYFYPLVSMDLTRRQPRTSSRVKDFGKGPMNTFSNVPAYPTAADQARCATQLRHAVFRGWLDLTKEPMVVSAPDTDGRYYLLPMLDMWTDVFASPGWRTTGTQAGNFLITPPGWNGDVPSGMTRINAPTPYVWIIGRTKTDGPPDYDAVHKIQAGYKVTPLSQWGKPPVPPTVKIDPIGGHENAAEGSGRHDACRKIFRLCSRASQGHSTAHHRPAHDCAIEEDRH